MAGPSFSDMQVEEPTMREVTNVRSEIKTSRVPEVGEGGPGRGCGGGCLSGIKNQVYSGRDTRRSVYGIWS